MEIGDVLMIDCVSMIVGAILLKLVMTMLSTFGPGLVSMIKAIL